MTRMSRPVAAAPTEPSETPVDALPPGAVDAHVHLVGDDFALSEGRVEDPAPGTLDHWLARYRAHLAAMGCEKGVIVHSILYGADNSVTVEAVRRMGAGFTGIGLVTDAATEADLDALVAAGLRGIRLNYVHGGVLSWEGMTRLAPALAERGLHVEMLAHSHLHLEELAPKVPRLPVKFVFDHAAWPDPALGPTKGHRALCRLLAEGQAWTKLSAPYRYGGAAADWVLRDLIDANPARCLWGSDWPHLMLNGVAMPDAGRLLGDMLRLVPEADRRQALFVDNPARLYGI